MSYENALCFLDMPSLNSPNLISKIDANCINISCLLDKNLRAKAYKCEIGAASFVLALLCKIASPLEFNALDEGNLSAESCFGEEEANEILSFLKNANFLILDKNLREHKDSENIFYFSNFLAQKFNLEIIFSDETKQDFKNAKFSPLKNLDNYDGMVLFRANLNDEKIHASAQFLALSKAKNGEKITLKTNEFSLERELVLDESLQGTIAFLKHDFKSYDFTHIKELR